MAASSRLRQLVEGLKTISKLSGRVASTGLKFASVTEEEGEPGEGLAVLH
jgi:hypothetical protein